MGAVEGTVQFLPSDLESHWRVLEKVYMTWHISRDSLSGVLKADHRTASA